MRTFSHGWDMSLSEASETSCGIVRHTGRAHALFRVNVAKQLWYDFGLGKGGDIFTLAGSFAKAGFHGAGEVHSGNRQYDVAGEKPIVLSEPSEPVFEEWKPSRLLRSPLTEYLEGRGHPLYAVASRHCCRLNYGVRGGGILPSVSERGGRL